MKTFVIKPLLRYHQPIPTDRVLYPAKALFLGLFITQILASTQVYISNSELYQFLLAINDAGYFSIPNELTMKRLTGFNPAFFGGLFFTLSIGASLSISGITAAWIWDRLFNRNKYLLIPFSVLWSATFFAVNFHGFCLIYTFYIFIIPATVFAATLKWMPSKVKKNKGLNLIILAVSIILPALLWAPRFSNDIFLDFRDNLLLSNSFGNKINNFYYKYTLYPAEVFKSFEQKLLKSCNLNEIKKNSLKQLLEKELLNHDYLPLMKDVHCDLKIIEDRGLLILMNKDRVILNVTPAEFLSMPGFILKKFSLKTDKQVFFRHFTFFSLLIGFPITLYIVFYSMFHLISSFFFNFINSSLIASILCLIFGISTIIPLYIAEIKLTDPNDISKAIESERWQDRVAAYKTIESKRLEVSDFKPYNNVKASPNIAERYWYARALGVSRNSKTYNELLSLLDDPHPNVVCMALYSLGQRGKKTTVNKIMSIIKSSDDWYTQDYAYRAIRKLGWIQTKLE